MRCGDCLEEENYKTQWRCAGKYVHKYSILIGMDQKRTRTSVISISSPWTQAAILLALTGVSAVVAPSILAPLFEGPEGTRWVGPFVLFMGMSGVLMLVTVRLAFFGQFTRSERWALGVLWFFCAMISFVVLQRLTSGLRVYETFNVLLSQRIAEGRALYSDSTSEPIGSIYPPFYFVLNGAVLKVFPEFLTSGRLISFGVTLGTIPVIMGIASKLGASRAQRIGAAILFLATYSILGTSYDTIAVDPLLMFLLALTLFFFLQSSATGDMMALFVGGLACATKQTAIFPLLVVIGAMLISRRSLSTWWPLVFWGTIGLLILSLSNGRAWRYLVTFPSGHPFRLGLDQRIVVRFFLLQLPLWIFLISSFARKRHPRFWFFSGAVLGASLLGVWKSGGWLDALIPFEPLLCAGAAPMLRLKSPIFSLQVLLGLFNPFAAIYPWSTIKAPDELIYSIARTTEGEIWAPAQSHLVVAAGKREWDHFASLESITWSGDSAPERLIDAVKDTTFSLVLFRRDTFNYFRVLPPPLRRLLQQNYEETREGPLVVFRPKRPDQVYQRMNQHDGQN